jgi:hypothetical protein
MRKGRLYIIEASNTSKHWYDYNDNHPPLAETFIDIEFKDDPKAGKPFLNLHEGVPRQLDKIWHLRRYEDENGRKMWLIRNKAACLRLVELTDSSADADPSDDKEGINVRRHRIT